MWRCGDVVMWRCGDVRQVDPRRCPRDQRVNDCRPRRRGMSTRRRVPAPSHIATSPHHHIATYRRSRASCRRGRASASYGRLMNRDKLIEAGVEAVRTACKVCIRVQADLVNAGTLEKGDKSPVTVADFAAKAVVLRDPGGALPRGPGGGGGRLRGAAGGRAPGPPGARRVPRGHGAGGGAGGDRPGKLTRPPPATTTRRRTCTGRWTRSTGPRDSSAGSSTRWPWA